ncbi:response regulator [Sinorhizobium mexicanum]|uniref:Response regulator n=1 Tax=Sinorhizobium mexicanum TaxID=375549 RepID=A0A859QKX6_9HYPH|nr:response regulator [Sinorhizobium mexicanum]MBP1882496.1 CheY-like chemotaxis protein [Sinorhizobium mexicanum]QLL62177.1 response regulator [Sinorhizobium mexicanum]
MQKTVLIVEDEFLIAMDLKLLLEQRGWCVLGPAATVGEALELLSDELPAVAILDVTLRDGKVTLVAETLRAQNVPFVVASAYASPELIGGEVLAGAPNVGKPTEERRLFKVLEQAVQSGP